MQTENLKDLCSPGPRLLDQKSMLARVRLLNITLGHLLEDKVAVDMHLLGEMVTVDTPLTGDGQGASRRLRNDLGIDAAGDIGKSQFVGGLSNRLLVGDLVNNLTGLLLLHLIVLDELRAHGLDHHGMVVHRRNETMLADILGDGSLDAEGSHLEQNGHLNRMVGCVPRGVRDARLALRVLANCYCESS